VAEGEVVDLIGPKGTVQVAVTAADGVAKGAVHLYVNQPNVDVCEIVDASLPVTEVRVGRR
jgi:hypothetical protein